MWAQTGPRGERPRAFMMGSRTPEGVQLGGCACRRYPECVC